MERLVFDLSATNDYDMLKEAYKFKVIRDNKDLDMFADYREHIINNNAILTNDAEISLKHIEWELKKVLEAFVSKGYDTFINDLKFIYKKTNEGFVGKILFDERNIPMFLYFEFADELRAFIGGERVKDSYNKTYCSVETSIYNFLAVNALVGLFGMDMTIQARDKAIFVEYKRYGQIYRLDIVYNGSKFVGLKKGIVGTTIGHWRKANNWAFENSTLMCEAK